jgi:hypothetical protein
MLLLLFLVILYRLLVHKPTLIVGPDGILDQGSLLVTGRGLLRWDELLTVRSFATRSGFASNQYLLILVPNGRAIRRRQPLWKRTLMLLLSQVSPFQVTIWQGLLDVPANELATQIDRYVQTHAPPGWLEVDNEQGADRTSQPYSNLQKGGTGAR